jgi:hypothetical protein
MLDRKLLRDLWVMKAQVISIALLIAAGVAVFVMSVSNYLALLAAQDSHYRNERFADLFAGVKRAPLTLVNRIREIDVSAWRSPGSSSPCASTGRILTSRSPAASFRFPQGASPCSTVSISWKAAGSIQPIPVR